MRIVTWNLKDGAGGVVWPRLHRALGADLVFLQEVRRPDDPAGLLWEAVPGNRWGSALLTTRGTIRPIPVPGYEGWVVGGELCDTGWTAPDRPAFAFSIHAPSKSLIRPRRDYHLEVEQLLTEIGRLVPGGADLVLAGDFNFTVGERAAGEVARTSNPERRVLARFTAMGLVSAWAVAHPGKPLAQTLRWVSDRAPGRSTPFHCDGIFLPAAWADALTCEVLTSAGFEVSDHYPVAAWVGRGARGDLARPTPSPRPAPASPVA